MAAEVQAQVTNTCRYLHICVPGATLFRYLLACLQSPVSSLFPKSPIGQHQVHSSSLIPQHSHSLTLTHTLDSNSHLHLLTWHTWHTTLTSLTLVLIFIHTAHVNSQSVQTVIHKFPLPSLLSSSIRPVIEPRSRPIFKVLVLSQLLLAAQYPKQQLASIIAKLPH